MKSLRSRLLLATSLTLTVFLVLGGLSLSRAYEDSAQLSQLERMQAVIYALLGNAESNGYGQLSFNNERLPDARLEKPQSGLEAALFNSDAALLWGSPSLGDNVPTPAAQPVGQWRFQQSPNHFILLFGMSYADEGNQAHQYTLMLMEDSSAYTEQVNTYRRSLWFWLGGAAAALLLLQGAVMRWSLRPLRRLVGELQEVESGKRERIQGLYPDELQPLTEGLNAMIVSERNQQSRYRNALGDLAHTLKTPLAVLRGIAERPQAADGNKLLADQVSRMGHIVDHQLKRAATAGGRSLSEPMPLKPLVDKITSALAKVYADRGVQFQVDIPAALRMRADAGDLYELLGNLLDNACKYGKGKVRISASRERNRITLAIEDNGSGFPDDTTHLLERGIRADTRQEGQGLGLGSVKDIVDAYEGRITLERSPALGGGRVVLTLSA